MSAPEHSQNGSNPEISRKVLCRYPPTCNLFPATIRRKRAEKCVKRGAARWIDPNTIELTEEAVKKEFADAWMWMQQKKLDQSIQDGTIDGMKRMMRPGELRNMPFTGQDLDRMYVVRRRTGASK